MENENLDTASSQIINVMVVIDTDSIIRDFPSRSTDSNSPTAVNNTKYFYMVARSDNTLSGGGTGNLSIRANVGDIIRWNGISESANFDSSILIYTLKHLGGSVVFRNQDFSCYQKRSMKPSQNTPFPVTFDTIQAYWFNQASIVDFGLESYTLHFAVYYRPTGGNPQLYGYFKYDPTIRVDA
jgi:hypothetical protein